MPARELPPAVLRTSASSTPSLCFPPLRSVAATLARSDTNVTRHATPGTHYVAPTITSGLEAGSLSMVPLSLPRPPCRPATATAALYRLDCPTRAKAKSRLNNVKIVYPEPTENSAKNFSHRLSSPTSSGARGVEGETRSRAPFHRRSIGRYGIQEAARAKTDTSPAVVSGASGKSDLKFAFTQSAAIMLESSAPA